MRNEELFDLCKTELIRSNADKRHPFRRVILSTIDEYPESRVVIKRKSKQDFSQIIFTDSRTPKVQHLKANPKSTLLFYHDKKMLQIRMKGSCEIVSEGKEYDEYRASLNGRTSDYQTLLTPGSILNGNDIHYDDAMHFVVIQFVPQEIDVLHLNREGHQRIRIIESKHRRMDKIENLVP